MRAHALRAPTAPTAEAPILRIDTVLIADMQR